MTRNTIMSSSKSKSTKKKKLDSELADTVTNKEQDDAVLKHLILHDTLHKSPETIRRFEEWCTNQRLSLQKSLRKVYDMFENSELRHDNCSHSRLHKRGNLCVSANKAEVASALEASIELQAMVKRQHDLNAAFDAAIVMDTDEEKKDTRKHIHNRKKHHLKDKIKKSSKKVKKHRGENFLKKNHKKQPNVHSNAMLLPLPKPSANVAVIVRVRPLTAGKSKVKKNALQRKVCSLAVCLYKKKTYKIGFEQCFVSKYLLS